MCGVIELLVLLGVTAETHSYGLPVLNGRAAVVIACDYGLVHLVLTRADSLKLTVRLNLTWKKKS